MSTSSLFSTPLKELVASQQLVTLDAKDTISKALDVLAARNFLGAPVVDKAATTTELKGNLIGFVDVLDLLDFLTKQCTKPVSTAQLTESTCLTTDDVENISRRTDDFQAEQVWRVTNFSKKNQLKTLNRESVVLDAVTKFVLGARRVVVVDEGNNPIGVISQRTILDHVVRTNQPLLSNLSTVKVSATPFSTQPVTCASVKDPAISVLLRMQQDGLSDIAVVDESNKLFGVLSASDIKMLKEGDFQRLLLPVRDFISDIRKKQQKPVNFCVTCSPTDTLTDLIHKILQNNVHRAFVLDKNGQPINVISMTDIMKAVFHEIKP